MTEFMDSSELNSETGDRREIKSKNFRQYYDGCIVRKDLTKSIRERMIFKGIWLFYINMLM